MDSNVQGNLSSSIIPNLLECVTLICQRQFSAPSKRSDVPVKGVACKFWGLGRVFGLTLATGWAQLAQKFHFSLLLPQQEKPTPLFDFLGRGNPAQCFSWWEADRGNAEVRSIMNMLRIMFDSYGPSIDASQIYVTGVSAGAAMAVDLLVLHPSCFAGGGFIAGIPFNCAGGSQNQAVTACMQPTTAPGTRPRQSIDEGGRNYSAERWGSSVRRICGDNRDCPSREMGWPRVSIWQGAQDRMVAPGNQRDLLRQWTNVHGIDEVEELNDPLKVPPYVATHRTYENRAGRVLVETWTIGDEGPATDHGVVIDPEEPTFPCGRTQDFVNDGNVCSTLQIARFWGLDKPTASPGHPRCAALN